MPTIKTEEWTDTLPLGAVWSASMVIHDLLKHEDEWEICNQGCENMAGKVILAALKNWEPWCEHPNSAEEGYGIDSHASQPF